MVIIDMEMPKACGSCPLREETNERVYNMHCKLLRYKYVHPDYQNRRLTDCPIKGDWGGMKMQIVEMAERHIISESRYMMGYKEALKAILDLMDEYEGVVK